jgi:cellulose synthase (UDP-forming)
VDEDLAVGLSAENVASYLVQRRRWMQGCLQIFFKDNPLLQRGLGLRHRLGYFASLWYFFFPFARAVFLLTPAWFLLFHLHPLFADVSELLGHLLPMMVLLPLASAAILPGWPRTGWGVVYEYAVALPLCRSAFDLLLPKKLAFKVTPKGIVSSRRAFDASSMRLTIAAAAVCAVAAAKGFVELSVFGIEKDAYFFNLSWAVANLLALAAALLVAWERPQRRGEERVALAVAAVVRAVAPLPSPPPASGGRENRRDTSGWAGILADLSLSGAAVDLDCEVELPPCVEVSFDLGGRRHAFAARVVRGEGRRGAARAGLAFEGIAAEARRALACDLLGRAEAWRDAHARRPASGLAMALALARGVVLAFAPLTSRRRLRPRRPDLRVVDLVWDGGAARALVRDRSGGGLGLWVLAWRLPDVDALPLLDTAGDRWARVAHRRRVLPFLWRLGLEAGAAPAPGACRAYLAA